jgi:hypothetical protein
LRRLFLGGILLGLTILTRDMMLFLPAFAVIFALLFRLRHRDLAIAAATAYIVVLPWVLTTGSLSEGRLGMNLWVGTWERNGDWLLPGGVANPHFPSYAFRTLAEEKAVRSAWASKDDKALLRIALDQIQDDPAGTAMNWAIRYPRLWIGTRSDQVQFRLERHSPLWIAIKSALYGLNLILLAAGLAGAWAARRTKLILFLIPPLYIGLVYVPFHNVEPRYSLAPIPFLCLFASVFSQKLRDKKNAAKSHFVRNTA